MHAAKIQQKHYDRVAARYLANQRYPHTQEYGKYLDQAFLNMFSTEKMDRVLEICCGSGEAIRLLGDRFDQACAVDISNRMLAQAKKNPPPRCLFVQADAGLLPVADHSITSVVVPGGIHHINDRPHLFAEIGRVLKPGGKFYWREPVDDFFLWRWLRAALYRLSPQLDHTTEQPLRYQSTFSQLKQAGFIKVYWQPLGLVGFCLFMNSDVLVFNRLFRFIPGIRRITRFFVKLDKLMIKIPGLKRAGLQVVGWAQLDNFCQKVV